MIDPKHLRRGDRVEVTIRIAGVIDYVSDERIWFADTESVSAKLDAPPGQTHVWRLLERTDARLGELWEDPAGQTWVYVGHGTWILDQDQDSPKPGIHYPAWLTCDGASNDQRVAELRPQYEADRDRQREVEQAAWEAVAEVAAEEVATE